MRNNEVRGADIRNSTIGGRDVAFNTLGGNDIKESTLTKVPDADNVDGVDSSAFLRKEAPAFAPLALGVGATAIFGEAAPAYDVDPVGYVHLQGTFLGAAGTAFTLPAGARPAAVSRFVVRRQADVRGAHDRPQRRGHGGRGRRRRRLAGRRHVRGSDAASR